MSDDRTDWEPSALLGKRLGPYELDSVLGQGGMGTVYGATLKKAVGKLQPGARVAVKTIHDRLLGDDRAVARFEREGRVGLELRHPNVVRTYEIGTRRLRLRKVHLLVMEYVEGQTLKQLIEEFGALPEGLCRHVGRDIARGLAAIHELGVMHRDLKPSNVIITPDHVVKVMDLGIARDMDTSVEISMPGQFIGSVAYASPEQLTIEARDLDARTDLWALGLTLYELAAGVHPFPADGVGMAVHQIVKGQEQPLGRVRPQVSPFLEEVVRALLRKDRDERLGPAAKVAKILEAGEESSWWSARADAIRRETQRPLRRVRIPRETGVHGRDAELATLRELYDIAKTGSGRAVVVQGEAGIGKTRIVEEFVERLRADGEDVNFLVGAYAPASAISAPGAFITAFVERFGRDALEEALGKDTLQTVFVDTLRALAGERPTVLLVDDLQFAPNDGRELFAALSLAVPGQRILLIGTARESVPEPWLAEVERAEHATRLPLGRLGPEDLVRLLADALRSDDLAGRIGAELAPQSGGNPFFLLEIVNGLRQGQVITRRSDGSWGATKKIEGIGIPSTVSELIRARVSGLGDEDRNLLEVAACCGFEFDPLLVGEVLGSATLPTLQRFGRIERAYGIVRSTGRAMRFDHHQLQEILYEGRPEPERKAHDDAIGKALERRRARGPAPSSTG